MKRSIFSLAMIIATAFSIVSCKKETAPPDTALELTVSDELGNKVNGATVALFLSLSDWQNLTNQVTPDQSTNAEGVVKFSKLASAKYYWAVIKDCKNNYNGSNTTTIPLTVNTTTKIGTVISSTGTLKFVNTSSSAYSIYVNGVLTIGALASGATQSLPAKPTGSYTIRVEQIGGSNIKTYTGTLNCGGTLTTTFP